MEELNLLKLGQTPPEITILQQLHRLPWNISIPLGDYFTLYKLDTDIQQVQIPRMDVIFYDAFAPSSQPELWEECLVYRIIENLRPGGVLVTFCSQGIFQRILKKCGLYVCKLPGPTGKREILQAHRRIA